LEQDEGTIVGDENLKVFISEYYKKLFGAPVQNNFSLNHDTHSDIPQVSREENVISQQSSRRRRFLRLKEHVAPMCGFGI
jgi:hypothetical protein